MNLAIRHTETFLYSMNNHYPRFSDISMAMNYHECIIHHDLSMQSCHGLGVV